jgi:GAF domain-containing protein/HAMP domain-containing protein
MAANGSNGAAQRPQPRLKVPLSVKFALITVGVVALLLCIAVAISLWSSYREAEQSALALQQEKAQALSARIDGAVAGLESQLAWTAQPDWKSAGIAQQRTDFARMLRQFPEVTELLYIDSRGMEQLKVSRLAPDSIASLTSHASEPRFAETVRARTWFGPVYVRNGSDLAGTVGLVHADGGVTAAELDLAYLSEFAKEEANDGTEMFVVDQAGRLIAHPERNPATGDTDLSALPQVATALAAGAPGATTDALSGDNAAFAAFAPVPRVGWTVIAEQPAAQALAPFYSLLWQSLLLLAIGLLVAAAAGMSLARRVTAPIGQFQAGAERIGAGDLTQRLSVRTRDEFGAFAEAFNSMASRLQQSQKGLEAKADERAHGLDVALQQQTLTAGVMKAIGRSGQSLDSVLETLVASAVQLCDAQRGAIWLKRGKTLRMTAQAGYPDEWLEPAGAAELDISMDAETPHGLAAYLGQPVTVEDLPGDQRFTQGKAPGYAGDRAGLAVPLKREGEAEGVIWLSHLEAAPFTDAQAGLIQGFADQALIAIENARLAENVDARDRKLADMRSEQTAMAEVIRIAAQSPDDARAVLDGITETAARLLGAGCLYALLDEGSGLKLAAGHGVPSGMAGSFLSPESDLTGVRAHASCAVADSADGSDTTNAFLLGETQSAVAVPLMRNNRAIGALAVERSDKAALPERHLELLKALADQAVAALTTTRLSADLHGREAELSASLDRQAATDGTARLIASPTFDLDVVCEAFRGNLQTLCNASDVKLFQRNGDAYREISGDAEFAPGRGSLVGRIALHGEPAQILDAWDDPEFEEKDATARSMFGLPLTSGGNMIGVLQLARDKVAPFSETDVEIASAFAALAAAAVEKANLLDDAEARSAEISTALREKAASAEMLRLVGRSSIELNSALEILAATMAEGCGAAHVFVLQERGNGNELVAGYGLTLEHRAEGYEPPDWMNDIVRQAEANGRLAKLNAQPGDDAGLAALAMPMTRDGENFGIFVVVRNGGSPFSDGQIELVESLADQATLAAVNTRLRDQLDSASGERDEALAHKHAASGIAALLGGSAPDARPVLDAIVNAAALCCGADAATLTLFANGALRRVAGAGDDDVEVHDWIAGRIALEAATVHLPDLAAEPGYAGTSGVRAVLGIPLLQDGLATGAFMLLRDAAGAFSDRQVELARTLADQAAVAVENEKLIRDLNTRTVELAEAHDRERAAGEAASAISRPRLKLDAVLPGLAASAARLGGADAAAIYLRDGDAYSLAAESGMQTAIRAFEMDHPHAISDRTLVGRAALSLAPVHVADVSTEIEGIEERPGDGAAALCVPLLRGGVAVGVFALTRGTPGPFAERKIELVKTFADMATVAIETVGLNDEVGALTGELAGARREQEATAETARTISGQAFDLVSLLQSLVTSAARLCGATTARVYLQDGENSPLIAGMGITPEQRGFEHANPPSPDGDGWVASALRDRSIVHIVDAADVREDDMRRYGDVGTALCVPLMRQDATLGAMVLARSHPGGFGESQIELVRTFADQAVIAIDNFRLVEQAEKHSDELAVLVEELNAARARLSETERLASLGQFTAGIMHEVRDPLTFIKQFSGQSHRIINEMRTILEAAVIDGDTRADIEDIADTLADSIKAVAEQGRRADSIIRNMLLHARGESGENRLVDINTVVDESLGLAYQGARAERRDFSITVEKALDPKAGSVDLYPQEITRVLLNVIANGFQATERRGAEENGSGYEPVLSASTKDLGDAVEIRIRDNGTGMAVDVRERMFEPFFSTKPAGQGTGLGLSLSRDIIVHQHAGTIDVETEPGSFTELRIVLPRGAASIAKRDQPEAEAGQSS